MRRRQRLAVHPVGQQRLRVPRIVHVDAFPQVVEGIEDDVPRARADANEVEDLRELHTRPFGDERPSFFAGLVRDLAGRGKARDVGEGERRRPLNEAVNGQFPVCEPAR
jgi:hypothetical protein